MGKYKGCINVPLVLASWKYNAEQRKKEVVKEDNADFIAQVGAAFSPCCMVGGTSCSSLDCLIGLLGPTEKQKGGEVFEGGHRFLLLMG